MAEKHIRVRSTSKAEERPRTLLNDQDAAHPEGHILIKEDGKAHMVGDTARVRELISLGALEIVEEKRDAKRGDTAGS